MSNGVWTLGFCVSSSCWTVFWLTGQMLIGMLKLKYKTYWCGNEKKVKIERRRNHDLSMKQMFRILLVLEETNLEQVSPNQKANTISQNVLEFILQCLRPWIAGSSSPSSRMYRIWASPPRPLLNYFFHLWSLVQTLGCGPTVGPPWSSFAPKLRSLSIPRKKSGGTTPTKGSLAISRPR